MKLESPNWRLRISRIEAVVREPPALIWYAVQHRKKILWKTVTIVITREAAEKVMQQLMDAYLEQEQGITESCAKPDNKIESSRR